MDALSIAVAAVSGSYRIWQMKPTEDHRVETVVFFPGYVDGRKVTFWFAACNSDLTVVR